MPEILQKLGGKRFQLACDIEGSEIALFIHSIDAFEGCELMMVELHHASCEGTDYTPQQVEALITKNLGMKKHLHYNDVYLFVREGAPAF